MRGGDLQSRRRAGRPDRVVTGQGALRNMSGRRVTLSCGSYDIILGSNGCDLEEKRLVCVCVCVEFLGLYRTAVVSKNWCAKRGRRERRGSAAAIL